MSLKTIRRPARARATLLSMAVAGCATLGFASTAQAAEGGSGVYVPGYVAPQAGLTPPPGTYVGYTLYLYNGDTSVGVSASHEVPIPGTEFKLPAQTTGSVKVEAKDLNAHIFTVTHVFPQKVLGGNLGLGVALPYIDVPLQATADGVTTLVGPSGATFSLPFGGSRSGSATAIGDVVFTGLLGWHRPTVHSMVLLNVYAPTGQYDVNRLVNVGKNHWAVEPMAAVTYLNPKSGLELSAAAGLTFNAKNSATDYKTGTEAHLDVAAIKHFSHTFYAGVVGYGYYQLTGDSGSGAPSDFKGQVIALGPTVGGIVALSPKHNLVLNARYYWEMSARNRLEGQALFLSAAVTF